MRKNFLVLLLCISSIITYNKVNAESNFVWKQNPVGWWYESLDGNYIKSSWKYINDS